MSRKFLFVAMAAVLAVGAPSCSKTSRSYTSKAELSCEFANDSAPASGAPSRLREIFHSDRVRSALRQSVATAFRKRHPEIRDIRYTVDMVSGPDGRTLTIVAKASDPMLAQFAAQKAAEILEVQARRVFNNALDLRVIDAAQPGVRGGK